MTRPQSVKFTPFRTFLARFQIGAPDECWLWQGYVYRKSGYGGISRWINGKQKLALAHRESYRFYYGEVPDDLHVRHLCHTPLCVNPLHLAIGTDKQNSWDTVMAGRNYNHVKTHCKRGHPLSGDNLYVTPSTGQRQCRTCQSAAKKRYVRTDR